MTSTVPTLPVPYVDLTALDHVDVRRAGPRSRRGARRSSKSYSYVPDWAGEHNDAMPADAPFMDIYARLSRNLLGELEKIEDQIADSRGVLVQRQWRLGMIHVDNSLSAWSRKVRRPGWEHSLQRMENDQTAGVVVFHQDRLLRQPRDLEKLIDLAEERSRVVAWVHGSRDLSNPDDRSTARIEVALACRQSDDTARRRRRRNAGKRERGNFVGGPRAFGFPGADATAERLPDGKKPRAPQSLVDRERAALRQASEDIALGTANLQNIADRWNAAGLLTSTGATWIFTTVRLVLSRPRNAGLITYQGEVVGKIKDDKPIVSVDLFNRVQAVFRSRTRGRVPEGTYLASGMVYCGRCGSSLAGRQRQEPRADGTYAREYFCFKSRGGCNRLSIDVRGVDAVLREWTITRLSSPEQESRLAESADQDAKRLEEIDRELEHIKRVKVALAARLAKDYDLEEHEAARAPLADRAVELKAEREEIIAAQTEEAQQRQVMAAQDKIAEQWDRPTTTREERRILLARALRGWRVVIEPGTPQGPRVLDQSRVRIEPFRPR